MGKVHALRRGTALQSGLGQLTLVEHSLCPLDGKALGRPLVHECSYFVSDRHRHRRRARVKVHCPRGLSAEDEFFLWGMLAITLAQEQPSLDVYAAPHYWLRQLGLLSASGGGKYYRRFREAIGRLAGVRYENDCFYDPLRGEHRNVSYTRKEFIRSNQLVNRE